MEKKSATVPTCQTPFPCFQPKYFAVVFLVIATAVGEWELLLSQNVMQLLKPAYCKGHGG